jgi:MoaA/NifB/PqqE/SkfB family radical SAM enzyme
VHVLKCDYDQRCQLSCPSCRVTHSKDFVDVPRVELIHQRVMSSGILDITDRLYVTGAGDPVASPLYWGLLKELHQLDLPDSLVVFLHTNGLLLDESHWAQLHQQTQDRVTEIGISVDAATADTYRAIRGGSWTKLWSNINFLNQLQNRRRLMLGMFYTVQTANYREVIPFIRLAWHHKVSWISITALRNWGTFTDEEYRKRAVHLPDHPEHASFRAVISDERVCRDPRIILDNFNPQYTRQEVICNPGALLPATSLTKKT